MAWNGTVTNLGIQLLQQWTIGGATLVIDGAKTGEGTVPVAQLMGQSNVAGTAHTVGISDYKLGDDRVTYNVQIQAEAQAYTAMQVGIFAHIGSGSSMLLALYQADPGSGISVYSSTDMPEFSTIFGADVEMSVEGDLDVTIDSTLLVSRGQMTAALALKLDAANVYNGLDKTAAGYALDARQGKALGDAIAKRNLETYTSVTQLNLTAGSATILGAYNAMPDNSMLYARGDDFDANELPTSARSDRAGIVAIIKRQYTRTYVAFWSKYATGNDYRMFQGATAYNGQDQNAPTGIWIPVWDTPVTSQAGGEIVKSASTGTTVGEGMFSIAIIGKIIQINFTAKITQSGSESNVYDVGIQVSELRALGENLPNFVATKGGTIHYFKNDGTLDVALEGDSGAVIADASGNYWAFGSFGSLGSRPHNDASYTLGQYITGTLYGVLP